MHCQAVNVAPAQSEAMVGPNGVTNHTMWTSEAFDPQQILDVQHRDELPGHIVTNNLTMPLREAVKVGDVEHTAQQLAKTRCRRDAIVYKSAEMSSIQMRPF